MPQVLAPDVKAYDCYGLHGASKGGVEGTAMGDRGDAVKAVNAAAHSSSDWVNRNELLSWAVDPDQRVRGGVGVVVVKEGGRGGSRGRCLGVGR
jgi:hypothetical protein